MVGDLSIVSWDFLAGLALAALACWVGWRTLRRRRRRRVALVLLVVAVLLSSASAATAVNRHFSYLPRFGDVLSLVDGGRNWARYAEVARLTPQRAAARYPAGAVVRFTVADRGSGFGPTRALVYLPPQYFSQPRRRFAVVYLFHGSPGVPGDWFHGGEAAAVGWRLATRGEPVILVSPRMSAGWLDDPECVDGVRERVETHFLRDVLPAVDGTLRTAPVRDARALAGMSAGGFCALNLGLRNRDLVSTIIDLSGYTRPTHAGGLAAIFGTGPAAGAAARANSPADYVRTLARTPAVRIWLDCGRRDTEVLGEMASLAAALRSDGIGVRLVTRPGGHTFTVWRPALADALTWAAPRLAATAAVQDTR
ncbi:MAG TPA: alpha/beta hydrolase-fold protein [Mycobacteriales bacterium]|nr:alpha/beta hydrolase-fold protein [Mycobacteriales bacterium]